MIPFLCNRNTFFLNIQINQKPKFIPFLQCHVSRPPFVDCQYHVVLIQSGVEHPKEEEEEMRNLK